MARDYSPDYCVTDILLLTEQAYYRVIKYQKITKAEVFKLPLHWLQSVT